MPGQSAFSEDKEPKAKECNLQLKLNRRNIPEVGREFGMSGVRCCQDDYRFDTRSTQRVHGRKVCDLERVDGWGSPAVSEMASGNREGRPALRSHGNLNWIKSHEAAHLLS